MCDINDTHVPGHCDENGARAQRCQSTRRASGRPCQRRRHRSVLAQENLPKSAVVKRRGHNLPYNVLVILPAKESNNDKFGLTIERARPVIDIAVQDVVQSGRMPPGWVNLTYWDDRYWEDSALAERYATVGMVQAYCEHRLDAILGFADSYGLATVTKVSAGLNNGVPVLTTAGMPSVLNMKKSYPS
ncbi:hypothetical protein ANCDUO_19762 [Ancylostoma duodenale]|uniref:Receptor ligand binding region domain-containing protein n=1 Tax=Ancylostoma duodenale TaxID=51022 RepID=A0A0C2CK49_9BILA|nr:hypothetical protein ANCDUO_19762 [Ancylostoma duodenale]